MLLLLPGAAAGASAPRVVVSTPPLHSLVAGVMTGIGRPYLLVSGDRSPHTYQLRPSAAARLFNADLVVWVGGSLEPFLNRPLATVSRRTAVIALLDLPGLALLAARREGVWRRRGEPASPGSGAVPEEGRHPSGVRPGRRDPHAWMDPRNARRLVEAVVARLRRLNPAHAAGYAANGEALVARLEALDAELARKLAPVRELPYVVLHDGFQYFERRYGLNGVGAVVASPERPPSAKRLRALRAAMREQGVRCLFREPQAESALATTLTGGTTVRRAVLDPLGAAQAPGPEAYFEMMTAAAAAMVSCLAR